MLQYETLMLYFVLLYFIARLTTSLANNQWHFVCRVGFNTAVNYGKKKQQLLNSAQMSSPPPKKKHMAHFIQLILYAVTACILGGV